VLGLLAKASAPAIAFLHVHGHQFAVVLFVSHVQILLVVFFGQPQPPGLVSFCVILTSWGRAFSTGKEISSLVWQGIRTRNRPPSRPWASPPFQFSM